MKLHNITEAKYAQNKYVDWVQFVINGFIKLDVAKGRRKRRVVEREDWTSALTALKQSLGEPIVERDNHEFARWFVDVDGATFYVDFDATGSDRGDNIYLQIIRT